MNKLDALWQYQEAELEVERLESQLRTTPARQKLNKLHAFLTEQQSLISSIQKQIDTRRAAVDKLSERFSELEHKYELEVSEFQAMKNDEGVTAEEMIESRRSLESMLSQIDSARRELYDTLAWLEKATAEYKVTYSKAAKAKKEYDDARRACEEETAALKPELEAANAALEKLRSGLDPGLLKKYNVVKGHHATPMARVENNQCGGCNMSLPTAVIKSVTTGGGLVECENCGRILYVPLQ